MSEENARINTEHVCLLRGSHAFRKKGVSAQKVGTCRDGWPYLWIFDFPAPIYGINKISQCDRVFDDDGVAETHIFTDEDN